MQGEIKCQYLVRYARPCDLRKRILLHSFRSIFKKPQHNRASPIGEAGIYLFDVPWNQRFLLYSFF